MSALLLAVLLGFIAVTQVRETLQIGASSTVFPFATTVAEHLSKSGEFKTPVVEPNGLGGGFKLSCSGVGLDTPDSSDASRVITAAERAVCLANEATSAAAGVREGTVVKGHATVAWQDLVGVWPR